ncbi:MAG: ADP-glyceromanno-heptose 6-epimerase [Candidatus Omnitrophica bacterium]|nr:ADP-glyceromanno-heptose 6-epimerase [Candidatus Omnitrophota bacterium]MDD3988071.1 ADP-glyceromanno-heptose 6-epimerase [Candidatus Omnitrophota bacterium]
MIILTGGAGFIGSCFLWKLNQQGIYDIIVVDNPDSPIKDKNLLGKRYLEYIPKDDFLRILESGKITGINKIIHMGACSSTILDDADYYLKNNYEYSKRLAAWAVTQNVHFIYASSAATYGDGSIGYDDAESLIPSLKPLNMYGNSKQLFDLWALENNYLKVFTGLKFFNVFGPNEYHKEEMMSVICKRFKDLKEGKPMRLFKSYRSGYEDGGQKRDFIYVKDAIEVMYYFYNNPQKAGIFNLGTGIARSWNDLALAMFSALGIKPAIEYIDMPDQIKGQYQYYTQAKMDKLRQADCDYKFTPLEEAVKDYCGYLKDNSHL